MAGVDYNALKKGGFIRQVQDGYFSMRLRIAGGHIKADELKKVYEIADKFGRGFIHMTSRQSIEIPFIKLEDIDTVKGELTKAGLEPGLSGGGVRTITGCQGSAVCRSGLIDSTALAKELDRRYYGRELPHKFKIGITGCRNNCLKAEENDLGIKGAVKPFWSAENCVYCGACQAICPTKAVKVSKDDKSLQYDELGCVNCGRCVKVCPKKAWSGKNGFLVFFGGLFGNRIFIGKQLIPIVFEKEDLHKVIETTLEFFKKHAKPKERFCYTLDRVGWDIFKKELEDIVVKGD